MLATDQSWLVHLMACALQKCVTQMNQCQQPIPSPHLLPKTPSPKCYHCCLLKQGVVALSSFRLCMGLEALSLGSFLHFVGLQGVAATKTTLAPNPPGFWGQWILNPSMLMAAAVAHIRDPKHLSYHLVSRVLKWIP